MSYDDFWAIITALEGVIECLLLSVRNRSETDRQRLCYVREVLDHSADNRCGTQLSSLECLNMNRFEIFDRSTNDQYDTQSFILECQSTKRLEVIDQSTND